MSNYIDVIYCSDDDEMLGGGYSWDDVTESGDFDAMLKAAIESQYPGTVVTVSDGSHDTQVVTDLDDESDVIEMVKEIENQVWENWLDTVVMK